MGSKITLRARSFKLFMTLCLGLDVHHSFCHPTLARVKRRMSPKAIFVDQDLQVRLGCFANKYLLLVVWAWV